MVVISYFCGRSGDRRIHHKDVSDILDNINEILKKYNVEFSFDSTVPTTEIRKSKSGGYYRKSIGFKWRIYRYENGKKIWDMNDILQYIDTSTALLYFLGMSIINSYGKGITYNQVNLKPIRLSEKLLRNNLSMVIMKMRKRRIKETFTIKRQPNNKWKLYEDGNELISNATNKDIYVYLVGMLTVL